MFLEGFIGFMVFYTFLGGFEVVFLSVVGCFDGESWWG